MFVYSVFMFWYLHDRMHIKGTWLSKNRITRRFFKRQRKYHDIHHYHISDEGLMTKNFGISTPIFDHVFGTYEPKLKRLNRKGIEEAFKRYRIKPPLSAVVPHDTPSDASANKRKSPADQSLSYADTDGPHTQNNA
jgi:sterol desaturase/sphingolipid hydroxylase (fatty acid hydroxylase superfamily)